MSTIYNKQNAERLDIEEMTKESYKEIKEDIKNSGITIGEVGHKKLRGLRAKIATIDDILKEN